MPVLFLMSKTSETSALSTENACVFFERSESLESCLRQRKLRFPSSAPFDVEDG